ncbi:MAG: DUF4383 domain-containing protein [Actinomycetota bacterium]|nr:DUF4383 domain-containing protein [Actinomycetota bacterium]
MEGQNAARIFALLLGLGYVAVGVIGFAATGFSGFVANTDDALIGLDLNVFHNIVHIAIGAGLLVASRLPNVAVTQGILIRVGLFYVVAALLGFIDYLQIISIDGNLAADNFLHLLSGAAAVVFGLIGVRQSEQARQAAEAQPQYAGRTEPRSLDERRAQWDREQTYREETY